MTQYSSNGSIATTSIEQSAHPIRVLHGNMEDFAIALTQEFTIESAIAPDLFKAAVKIVCDSEIAQCGEVTGDPVADFLNWAPKTSQNGYSMKRTIFAGLLHNENGAAWQAKVNYQSWNEEKGRYGKPYLAPKKEGVDEVRAYFPPVPPSIRERIAQYYKVEVPMTGSFWEWVEEHPSLSVVVTEGAKKALAALSQGVIAIALYGCNSGYRDDKDHKAYRLISDLLPFCDGGREVIIAFDKDESKATQDRVSGAVRKMGGLMQMEGAVVKLAQWSAADGKGIDDLIVAKGGKAFLRAVSRAKVLGPMAVGAPKEYVESHKPTQNQIEISEKYEITNAAATPDHHLNIHLFEQGQGDWCVINGAFHFHKDGVWNAVPDSVMDRTIADNLAKLYVMKTRKIGDEWIEEPVRKFGNGRGIASVMLFNRAALTIDERLREHDAHYLNFLNGVLDVKSNRFIPYQKDFYLNTQIQADYVMGQECPTDFLRFVYEAYGPEQLELIRAMIRYCLDMSMPDGKFFHLVGPSGSGKGTLLRFLGAMHGDHYRASNDMSILNSPEQRYQNLTGARMIAFPDMMGVLPKLGAFYELVDNGALTQRPLYSSSIYIRKANCRFLLASTEPFQFEKSDAGWDRRCIPIATIGRKGVDDTDLADRLEKCMAQVISWAMALEPAMAKDILWNAGKYSPHVDALKTQQAIASDSVKGFIDACLAPVEAFGDDGPIVPKMVAYGWYKAYCEATGQMPKAHARFVQSMKTALGYQFEQGRSSRMVDGRKVNTAAAFKNLGPCDRSLFVAKKLPGGEIATPEMALFSCNAKLLQDGNLISFQRPIAHPITQGITQATQGSDSTLSNGEPILGADYSSYSITQGNSSHICAREDNEKENPDITYRGKNALSNGVDGVTQSGHTFHVTQGSGDALSKRSNGLSNGESVETGTESTTPTFAVGDSVEFDFQFWTIESIRPDGTLNLAHRTLLKATAAKPGEVVPVNSDGLDSRSSSRVL